MIRLERVRKEYGDGTVAVHDLDLDVGEGEVCVLIGPSGCGKTTTMRMINRLVEPTSGRILLDGDDVTRVDPVELRRRIGYVIQHVGLFPHQTVSANVGTVPRLLGWDRKRTRERSTELLELVGLDPARFGSRYPHELSGGQRQRVGVARALAADPPVLLMDEPFGAVDPIARDRLQAEFLRLQEQVRKTVVIVTHDMDEAVRLGDRVAVMRDGGYLEQYDAPGQIYAEPATAFVADFIGADRAARRLAVAHVTADALVSWPTVDAGASLADARSLFDAAEADQLVVLSGSKPLGWVQRDEASGDGVVGDRVQEAEQVQLGQSLEDALGLLIAAEHPGVLVSDKDRLAGVLTAAALVSSARAG